MEAVCAVEEAAEGLLAVVEHVLPATPDVLPDPAPDAPAAVVLVLQVQADADSAELFSAAVVEALFASVAAGLLASAELLLQVASLLHCQRVRLFGEGFTDLGQVTVVVDLVSVQREQQSE